MKVLIRVYSYLGQQRNLVIIITTLAALSLKTTKKKQHRSGENRDKISENMETVKRKKMITSENTPHLQTYKSRGELVETQVTRN